MKPSRQILSRGIHDDHSKRRPAKRDLDEEEDIDDVRGLIRKMFRFGFISELFIIVFVYLLII